MRTIAALVATVTVCMTASVVGLAAVRAVISPAELQASNDVCGGYLQTLGTIYAVLLAFVVFVVWTQANDVRRLVERQADELADVLRVARTLGGSVALGVLAAARGYVGEVAGMEWPLLADGRSCPRAAEMLDRVWQALVAFEPRTGKEQTLFDEAVSRFSEFGDARADLLHCGRVRLPVLLWLLIVCGAVGTVGSMYLFGAERFWPLATMTASLAGAISFMLFLIRDLDNPFRGDWQVTPGPIVAVVDQAQALMEAARTQAFPRPAAPD